MVAERQQDAAERAASIVQDATLRAKELAVLLTRTAAVLEQSALVADGHAQRCEQSGHPSDAARERHASVHARETADRARAHAARWDKLADDPS